MGNRAAKFISTLVASILAGAPLAAVSQNAPTPSSTAAAAPDCLASPKDAAPQGQHWYYRLDRTTKRKCWYLRAAGGKAAQTAQATDASEPDTAPPQAVQNARAEYIAPQTSAAASTPNMAAPAPAAANAPPVAPQPPSSVAENNAQQPAVTARWPEASTASTAPAHQPAETTVAAAAQPNAKLSKSPAPLPPAADGTTDKSGGSLQMLMLVIGGALALAGILASVIYRFAGGRVRARAADRRGHWDDWAPQDHDGSHAPWRDSPPAAAQPPRPIDFDAARPQPTRQVTKLAAIGREIELIDARRQRAVAPAAKPVESRSDKVETKLFDRAAAPKLAANEIEADRDDAPAGRDTDAVDVDAITTMLEQLAKEGPRLSRPNLEADLANFARSLRGQSAARA
ncbi:hypothetical protein I6F30_04225 [Bradyrhizobium sp. NBAIM20]|uniref:Uncharacterized protein n=1 Tax=Bradyrhizobium yuanmingense TaxID=108015 RepID=A0ABV4GWN6_9BRAD|nr:MULTISPECIES: hypothetical protein [Bradyrhizobium]MCA1410376.1 hypothetical protein [Bradyrhizobium sp. NBAIM20]MCA1460150.1 hypothetical protein [Bradyrhizobium sp. NBAIM18]